MRFILVTLAMLATMALIGCATLGGACNGAKQDAATAGALMKGFKDAVKPVYDATNGTLFVESAFGPPKVYRPLLPGLEK